MKKKILSLLLAFAIVFSVFIPVNIMPETELIADAATVTCNYEPIGISSYQELDEALRQAYNGMVLQLTQDINVGATSADMTIRPDMTNMTVVLDLNGHNIKYSQVQNSTFRGIDLNCSNSNFHIINSAYDKGDAKASIGGYTTGFSFLFLDNPTASCYIGPGVEIKGSNASRALVCLDFFKNFVMYESDITVDSALADNTTDCIMFAPAQGYGSAYSNSNFRLNKCNLTTKKGDCIDLRYFGTFTANKSGAMSFVLNQTMLKVNHDDAYAINLSHAQNASSNVNVGDLCYEPGIINVHGYNPYVGNCFFSGKIQSIFSGCDIYFYNNAYRTSSCSHSGSRANIFSCSASQGHIWVCSKCYCDYYYSGHSVKNYKAPTATAAGNTSGYNCSCGYVTYYELPADAAIDPFTKVQEVASWSSLETALSSSHPTVVRLKTDIVVEDHNSSYTLRPATRGNLVIDLNGHSINVNSNKTQYLFDLSRATYGKLGTHLAIVDSTDMGGGDVFFATTQKGASVVNLAHKANSLSVIRATINLGSATDSSLNNTEAWAQTFAIDCKAAHMLNIYTAEVNNYKQNGTSIRFVMDAADVFKNTTVRIYRSTFDFKTFGLDFDNDVIIKSNSFKDFTISNNNTFTPLNSTARVMNVNGSTNTATLGDIVDADYHFVDGTYSVAPTKTLANSNFDAGKEYWTKWRWNSSIVCAHEDFVSVLHAVFGDYQYCTRCKKGFAEDHHIVVDDERTTYADCTQDGEIFYICDDPGCGYEYSVKETAKGHIPNTDDEGDDIIFRASPATCTDSGISADYFECFVCREFVLLETGEIVNEEDLIIEPTGHDYKFIEKHNPTCTSSGAQSNYWICTVCHNYFVTDAKTPISLHEFSKNIYLPKLSHKLTAVGANPATCTTDGNIAHYKCTRENCGMLFSDSEGKNEITTVKVPATGHNLQKVAAVKPTCTANGTVEHYKCTVCGKLFSDAEGKNVITDVIAKAPGHTAGNWQVKVAAQVGKKGTEVKKCTVCNTELETRDIPALAASHTHTLVLVKKVPATCTANGTIEHYKCSGCAKLFSDAAATKEITDSTVKAPGHSYEWVVTKPAQVGVAGEQALTCKVCKDVKEKKPIAALEAEYMLGDVDFSKKVDATDARLALRAAVGLDKLSDTAKKAADVDKNNAVDATDARIILRVAVGLDKLN